MPPLWIGKARPRRSALAISLDRFARRQAVEEAPFEKILLPAETRFDHPRAAPDGAFVSEQGFQYADRSVERRSRRAVRGLAVPAAVRQLVGGQPVDNVLDILTEVCAPSTRIKFYTDEIVEDEKEIRIRDSSGICRVMYVAKFEEAIYALHCFQKKTRVTSNQDKAIAGVRYRAVLSARKETK